MSNERRAITAIETFDLDGTLLKAKTQGTYKVLPVDNLINELLEARLKSDQENSIEEKERRLAKEVYDYYEFKEYVAKHHLIDKIIVIHTRGDNLQRPLRLLQCLGVDQEHCIVHAYDANLKFLNIYRQGSFEQRVEKTHKSSVENLLTNWGKNYFFDFERMPLDYVRDLQKRTEFLDFSCMLHGKNAHIAGLLVDIAIFCQQHGLNLKPVMLKMIDDDSSNCKIFMTHFKSVYETLNLVHYTGINDFNLLTIEAGSAGFMRQLEASNNAASYSNLFDVLDVKLEKLQNNENSSSPQAPNSQDHTPSSSPPAKKTKVRSDEEDELSQIIEPELQNQEVKPEF